MPTHPEATKPERVPRADKLNLLRDILHLLNEMEGVSGRRRLFYETKMRITKPEIDFSVESTFNDYLIFGNKLNLIKITKLSSKILEKGKHLVNISKFGERSLRKYERSFLRSLLLAYLPFRTFVNIGFCEGRAVTNDELYQYAKCPKREALLDAYMRMKEQDTDREARTLLGWSVQVGLAEFDEYSGRYYLIKERDIEPDLFLNELRKAYLNARDPRSRTALIPEVRFQFCCSMKIQRSIFDRHLLESYEAEPSKVQLGKGSASRQNVLRFGVRGKIFYYYYITVLDVDDN